MIYFDQIRQRVIAIWRSEHWWGEFWTSAIGAGGWSLLGLFAPDDSFDGPIYAVLKHIAPLSFWQSWLLIFGTIHLIGLFLDFRLLRILGAACLCWAFCCIFGAVALVEPWTKSLALYAAAVGVYVSAIAYHTCGLVVAGRLKRDRAFGPST